MTLALRSRRRAQPRSTDPTVAAVSVTNIGVGYGSTVGSYTIRTPDVPNGSLIVVLVSDYGGAGAVFDAAGNKYTRIMATNAGLTSLWYTWNCAHLNNGDYIGYIKADGWNGSIASAFYATGIDIRADPHDATVDAFHSAAQTAKPIVTAAAATAVGNLYVAFNAWAYGPSPGITQAPGWAFPPNDIWSYGIELAGGNMLCTDATLKPTYGPTVNGMTAPYYAAITAFKAFQIVPPVEPTPPPVLPGTIDECQNPLYPDDRFMTEDEKSAKGRECAMMRAQSPGERICIMDFVKIEGGEDQNPVPHLLSHSYEEYMDYRHSHFDAQGLIIADGESWTPWLTYDEWAEIAPQPPPPPDFPRPPTGWNPRMQVVPGGIPQMNGVTASMLGYTFVTKTPPVTIAGLVDGGVGTRLTIIGNFQTIEMYVSPAYQNTFVVDSLIHLYRITVGGQTQFTVAGQVITDPLPYGIDGSGGFLVTAFISAAPATLGFREPAPGWASRSKHPGNWTTQLDKSGTDFIDATQDCLALLMVEGYYGPID